MKTYNNISETSGKSYLMELLNTPSPSGYERFGGIEVFKRYCRTLNLKEEFTDAMGNCAFSIGNSDKSIMISGHIDEIGFQVSNITKEGMVNIVSLGGIDKKTLPGSIIEIIGNSGKIVKGIIGKKPIHIENSDERNEVTKLSDTLVDIGARSKEEAEELVSIGSVAVFERNLITEFGEHGIMSKGLDDKIGVFITSLVMAKLKVNQNKNLLNTKIYGVANTQEELGLRGATVTSKRINPTYSIDIDVTFANDEGRDIKDSIYGSIELGKGPVIEYGPDKSNAIINTMKRIAKTNNIPVQFAVSYAGGTNTDAIQLGGMNTETVHIAIPNRNMHTQVEVCDYRDIDAAIDLIYLTVLELSE